MKHPLIALGLTSVCLAGSLCAAPANAAGDVRVRAVGTAFNVRQAGERVVVTVTKGKVDVYRVEDLDRRREHCTRGVRDTNAFDIASGPGPVFQCIGLGSEVGPKNIDERNIPGRQGRKLSGIVFSPRFPNGLFHRKQGRWRRQICR